MAVSIRSIVLKEVQLKQWLRLVTKDPGVELLTGLSVALVCAFGIYVWFGSLGLALVAGASMLIAMFVACFAGALVPIALTRLDKDPAAASAIILTTFTDVSGFFAFLGLAYIWFEWL